MPRVVSHGNFPTVKSVAGYDSHRGIVYTSQYMYYLDLLSRGSKSIIFLSPTRARFLCQSHFVPRIPFYNYVLTTNNYSSLVFLCEKFIVCMLFVFLIVLFTIALRWPPCCNSITPGKVGSILASLVLNTRPPTLAIRFNWSQTRVTRVA